MQRFRRAFVAWLGLAGLVGALFGPASGVAADPLTAWTAGPSATGDPTYDGFIDTPQRGATVPTGGFTVGGWFVDTTAQGWAGADDVQIWLGTMDSGKLLTKAVFATNRPDVASAESNPFFAASGFSAVIPAGALSAGQQTLSVYVHTGGKGWWYKQVNVSVSGSAPAAASTAPAASAPAAPVPVGAAGPVVSGGALPTVVVEQPTTGQNISDHGIFTIIGYALDKNAAANQGVQGTGIDRVEVYVDAERDNGGTFEGDADLAFGDPVAAAQYGSQFASAGWRLDFKPTTLHTGSHELFVYARSVVTGKENLATQPFTVTT